MKRAVVPVGLTGEMSLAGDLDGGEYGDMIAAAPNAGRVSRADVEAFTAALIRAWPEPFRGGHPGYTAITDAVRAALTAIGLELETE